MAVFAVADALAAVIPSTRKATRRSEDNPAIAAVSSAMHRDERTPPVEAHTIQEVAAMAHQSHEVEVVRYHREHGKIARNRCVVIPLHELLTVGRITLYSSRDTANKRRRTRSPKA